VSGDGKKMNGGGGGSGGGEKEEGWGEGLFMAGVLAILLQQLVFQLNRVTPVDVDHEVRPPDLKAVSLEMPASLPSSFQSGGSMHSVGSTTFGRTPPPVSYCAPLQSDRLTSSLPSTLPPLSLPPSPPQEMHDETSPSTNLTDEQKLYACSTDTTKLENGLPACEDGFPGSPQPCPGQTELGVSLHASLSAW
jgi:hypothetical protein